MNFNRNQLKNDEILFKAAYYYVKLMKYLETLSLSVINFSLTSVFGLVLESFWDGSEEHFGDFDPVCWALASHECFQSVSSDECNVSLVYFLFSRQKTRWNVPAEVNILWSPSQL
ncbi:Hypothetical_protein [Hexamita inflata]|uniref:Hypothetical_protein n=1 Tax=Hexamita inflata TaxID=28002 RepID=A0AA86U1L8_9EUKA|nr:Hypothetical protein HINF_LOCUS22532 [Hexamita inflata]